MGTLEAKDKTPATDRNNDMIAFIDKRFKEIVSMSSVIKLKVFNMDESKNADMYSSIVNSPLVKVIKEDTSFATYEESDVAANTKSKDTYYKVALKYLEIDTDKIIEEVKGLVKSKLVSASMAVGLVTSAFPGTRKDRKALVKVYEGVEKEAEKQEKLREQKEKDKKRPKKSTKKGDK